MDERRPIKDMKEMDFLVHGSDEPVWLLSDSTHLGAIPFPVMMFLIEHKLIETANPADINNFARNNPAKIQLTSKVK